MSEDGWDVIQMKEHRFTLVVKTCGTRKNAELDVLSAFAVRSPDGSEFYLRKAYPKAMKKKRKGKKGY